MNTTYNLSDFVPIWLLDIGAIFLIGFHTKYILGNFVPIWVQGIGAIYKADCTLRATMAATNIAAGYWVDKNKQINHSRL